MSEIVDMSFHHPARRFRQRQTLGRDAENGAYGNALLPCVPPLFARGLGSERCRRQNKQKSIHLVELVRYLPPPADPTLLAVSVEPDPELRYFAPQPFVECKGKTLAVCARVGQEGCRSSLAFRRVRCPHRLSSSRSSGVAIVKDSSNPKRRGRDQPITR